MAHQDFEKYAEQRLMNGTVSEKYRSFFMENVFPVLGKEFRVLDYGCGDGKYFGFFRQFASPENIYGVEISETRTIRCIQAGWNNVFKVDPLKSLPFPDSFFDLINFDQVIEHIKNDEIMFYLTELKRVLADGGLIIVLTPNYPIKRLYDIYSAIVKRELARAKDDPTHITKYSFNRLRKVLSVNFNILKLEPTGGFIWKRTRNNLFSHKIIGLVQKSY